MPELPEVENVRRTVERAVLGRLVLDVQCFRGDVFRGDARGLVGRRIAAVLRHGKQLALVGEVPSDRYQALRSPAGRGLPQRQRSTSGGGGGGVVCVHLGMTGSLRVGTPGSFQNFDTPGHSPTPTLRAAKRLAAAGAPQAPPMDQRHIHVVWTLDDGKALWFRDPRRFGGLWAFDSLDALRQDRWSKLGPDALTITPQQLRDSLGGRTSRTQSRGIAIPRLSATRSGTGGRPIKAALLDQAVVAGLGNIYVDELLFTLRVDPRTPAGQVAASPVSGKLPAAMRRLLGRAIDAGGTTLRDYVDASGTRGMFRGHRVYGRGGRPCVRCKVPLTSLIIAGRTTVCCEGCQG